MAKPAMGSGGGKYKKGFYKIQNVQKYIGNPSECIYRSSWELKFMIFCDYNENIKKWGSETAEIQYYLPNDHRELEIHRYYPDFYIEKSNPKDTNDYRKYFLELKPYKEYKPDIVRFNEGKYEFIPLSDGKSLKAHENWQYQAKTFEKNMAKWQAADAWCRKRGMQFKIAHEKILADWGVIVDVKNNKF